MSTQCHRPRSMRLSTHSKSNGAQSSKHSRQASRNDDLKKITHSHPNRDLLFKELTKDPIGHLIAQPSLIESLFYDDDISFLCENGTKMFIPTGEVAENSLRDKFAVVGIPVRANYSSEEAGLIAAKCKDCPENFHVAQSNVIVEVDNRESVVVDGNRLGRVLVTHLHSYATSFQKAALCPTELTTLTCFKTPRPTSIASCAAQNLLSFRYRRLPSTKLSSTSRQPKRRSRYDCPIILDNSATVGSLPFGVTILMITGIPCDGCLLC